LDVQFTIKHVWPKIDPYVSFLGFKDRGKLAGQETTIAQPNKLQLIKEDLPACWTRPESR